MSTQDRGPVLPSQVLHRRPVIRIDIANEQERLPIDESRLRAAVTAVVGSQRSRGSVSLALVDDTTIHELNRRYLNHDYATDVLSFLLEDDGDALEGEIVVSTDTAVTCAARFGWSADDELLLYVIHGALHLVGWDDQTPEAAAAMRAEESRQLAAFGLVAPRQERDADARRVPIVQPHLLGEGSPS